MTDRIDLDELDAGGSEDDGPNPGDWFWRGDGDPTDEPEAVTEVKTTSDAPDADSGEASANDCRPMPRVPRANEDSPAGIPTESGGAGAGATPSGLNASADETKNSTPQSASDTSQSTNDTPQSASGPHGGGADDMTLAFTYRAATRLSNFGAAAADADGWADWVGIVGRVPAHVLNKFQRDRRVDLDFFNGSARGPGERLADVGPTSMFYAERTVVVGIAGEDEEIAERADWEFVPLAEAAEKAGWEVDDEERADGDAGTERPPE